jgi:hypothetical protein
MPAEMDENGADVSDAMSDNENEDDSEHLKDEDDKMAEHNASSDNGNDTPGGVKKKYDPKDPLRPRRKKARRACFACQRAHLTCGKLTLLFLEEYPAYWNYLVHPPQILKLSSFTLESIAPEVARLLVTDSVVYRRREAMPTMHKAWSCRSLSRWCSKKGEIPA